MYRILITVWTLLALPAATLAEAPFIDPVDDSAHFGDPNRILFWTPEQQVAGYRNIARIHPTRQIPAGEQPLSLPRSKRDLGSIRFSEGDRNLSVDEYFVGGNVAGLLVIQHGRIVYERYGLGNTEDTLWISFSVAKSVTSLLLGAAIQDGYIRSVEEKVSDYLPRLRGSAYDQVSIRHLLQMASGVEWNEDYADPESDVNTATWDTLSLYEYLGGKSRAAPPGTVFNYNTAETNLVGTLVRSAVGNNLATYLSARIWKPFGMEHDANWGLSEADGGEFGGSNISATLRDFGRIGLFVLNDGRLADGTPVLPDGWIEQSTTPSPAQPGYGYQWWLRGEGAFAASGIFGQAIHIVPRQQLVIAMHSARARASHPDDWALQLAMFKAITRALGGGDGHP